MIDSPAETHREDVNGFNYDMVSKNLTISSAQASDEGMYYCNVTDGKGRVFSVSKKIVVYGNHSHYDCQ